MFHIFVLKFHLYFCPYCILACDKHQILYCTLLFKDWDPERSLVSNLEHILGAKVVRRSAESVNENEGLGAECAVCYCLHLEESLPDLTCNHCSQSFHVRCLYEACKKIYFIDVH